MLGSPRERGIEYICRWTGAGGNRNRRDQMGRKCMERTLGETTGIRGGISGVS